ncbi:AMP-dependent synthetase/ligase [Nocardioides marmotae]|uniref:Acyl-CoA synthetase n=1 Tax=Nocardioides marmotae TaxID=2663857 RepID=A0A6I3JGE6_9ACTN|nr:AMP-dependent synthetase/ligase [Nocardioides marmotae]MCR6033579.1 AMP-binding protein [Gordonia jinghuaiqii]MBC9735608.1 long-chain fatty acid--CoA ligase [Nocardioides marmotae]MTB86704.1 AMP-binding protein [Nocardioides marmotae]MTB97237.1 AMP-binding protein [Nocardioides marmotae]QKE02151.1 long-chain fatty acid--CoA ligase [Nocardioides marmotae]
MPVIHDTSFVDHLAPNMAVQFLDRVAASSAAEAFRFPRGEAWESVTWAQAGERVRRLAAGLLALGLESEQRVGIAAGTRYEWILSDLAVMCAGGATTTVYPTTNAPDVAYILGDAECRIVFAEDDEQLAKIRGHKNELPHLMKVVTFDGAADGDWVITMDHLAELGEKYLADHPDVIEKTAQAIKPEQLATLIYTSGTTGRPKGVRLQHRSWVYEGAAIQAQDILHEEDLQFLWLPMAHSFGKVLLSSQLACGFATAIDGRIDKIVENLGIVKPTFMGAAPRIFEKAHGRIVTMQAAEGGAKEKLFKKAFEVGIKVDRLKRDGKSVPLGLKLQHGLFDKLVFSKVRDRFGGRVRFFISGSAALNQEIAEWFNAAGILILEGYGMTENAAGATVNHPDGYKMGTVGPALPGAQVRIGKGDEVQIKGPHVMEGYHNLPEETAKAFTEDGWLRTGDKGSLDADGFLTITGRIKDLFKTSGGKYIAPSAIESKFKALCPYTSQFMVFGNERNYCVALITLDPDAMAAWAGENGMADKSYSEVVASPQVKEMVAGYVEQLNGRLNRWETIKKWEILDHDLTIESGELTPSMKVKRNVVEDNNKARIDALYAS